MVLVDEVVDVIIVLFIIICLDLYVFWFIFCEGSLFCKMLFEVEFVLFSKNEKINLYVNV